MAGGIQDYWGNKLLNQLGGTTISALTTVYLALYTVMPQKDGSNATEVSGGAYARQAITCNTTNFPVAAAQLIKLATSVSFPTATADWAAVAPGVVGWGICDAVSGGNILITGEFVAAGAYFAFVGLTSNNTITAPGTAYTNGNIVRLQKVPGSTLPAGIAEGTSYYVVSASTDTFKVSLTLGGAAITLTADGGGLVGIVQTKQVLNGDTVTFNANQIQIQTS